MTGQYELTAPLVDHDAFDADTFDAPLGETVETRVFVRVRFAALDAGDNALVEAGAADSVAISVTNTSVEPTANVVGSGSVTFQVKESDPAPS